MPQPKQWTKIARTPRPAPVGEVEKQAIITACEALIRDILKPSHLPRITPSEFNYVVDIRGAWAAGRYRFMQRYRCGMPHNAGEEFDAPFARLDRVAPDHFDIHWMRHTGKWWRLHYGVTLAQAIHIIETDGVLHPH